MLYFGRVLFLFVVAVVVAVVVSGMVKESLYQRWQIKNEKLGDFLYVSVVILFNWFATARIFFMYNNTL